MTLSQKVKELRMNAGSSQDELASATQLSLRTIQRIENGETQPRGDSLKRLARALGVATEELTASLPQEGREPVDQVRTPEDLSVDKGFLIVLHLSALCVLLFPFQLLAVMGVLVPLVLWLLKKDKIQGVRETGKKILTFQISWFLVFALIYGYVFFCRLNHVAAIIDRLTLFRVLISLYVINVIGIIVNLFRHLRSYS